MKRHLSLAALTVALMCGTAQAQVSVKVGVLSDMSSLYSDIGGAGSVAAAKLAIADFAAQNKDVKVDLVSADHQNKPDIGADIARQWYERDGGDAIIDVPSSAVALAVADITTQMNKVNLNASAGTTRLTGDACSPNLVHWNFDNFALANVTGRAVVATGGDSWFFITADYAFGHDLEAQTSAVVKAQGGKVLGGVRAPWNTPEFSSFLLQAQSSGAKVIGLANAGGDTINSIKQAAEFGIVRGGQKMAGLLVFINDVHSLGLEAAQGMLLTNAFYWDRNEESRAWAQRYFQRMNKMPNMSQAGIYSATTHYLKAIEAAGTDETGAVMAKMHSTPINDVFVKNGKIREDGRMVHDMYLYEVKKPSESTRTWDYYKYVATIPADQAFLPLSESKCPLVKR